MTDGYANQSGTWLKVWNRLIHAYVPVVPGTTNRSLHSTWKVDERQVRS